MEYVVFDLETTGFSPENDDIIEIGAVLVDRDDILERPRFHRLVRPMKPIPWRATMVHGIRDADVRGAPTLDVVLPEFLDFVGERPVVAHNIGFDMGFVQAAMRRHGLLWLPPQEICTMQLSRRAFPRERSHKLDSVAERLGLHFPEGARHRSVGDALVTAQAFLQMRRHV